MRGDRRAARLKALSTRLLLVAVAATLASCGYRGDWTLAISNATDNPVRFKVRDCHSWPWVVQIDARASGALPWCGDIARTIEVLNDTCGTLGSYEADHGVLTETEPVEEVAVTLRPFQASDSEYQPGLTYLEECGGNMYR